MPFSIAPDPRFLFMSEPHREAMAHLLYGVKSEGGIVLLTGEVGTGKTTICRSLLEQLPENIDVAFILNPRMSVEELLQTICEEFHIEIAQEPSGIKKFVDAINARLLTAHAQGRSAILIIDEAQNLDSSVLEQLRLLTNLETSTRKLLQIFLIGQPELNNMLSRPEMRQVSQRVIARYHLTRLSRLEVYAYVTHRLRISGASPLIFPESLMKEVYRASNGIPRLINLICDRALLGAYSRGIQQITMPVLRQGIKEVFAAKPKIFQTRTVVTAITVLLVLVVILLLKQFPDVKERLQQSALTNTPQEAAPVPPPVPVANLAQPVSSNTRNDHSILPITSLEWPGNVPRAESELLAFNSLFKLYGVDIDSRAKESPCQQAETQGMHCYAGRGGLTDLVQLDQPVLTRLSSADGKEYSATLTDLDHESATLMVAGVARRVSLMELANYWFGQYILVWNSPPGFSDRLSYNDRGPAVIWLRRVLESVDGIRDNGSDVFDAPLAKRVHTFQLTEGLQPDGVVGPLTVIHHNVRSGKVSQHLVAGKRG